MPFLMLVSCPHSGSGPPRPQLANIVVCGRRGGSPLVGVIVGGSVAEGMAVGVDGGGVGDDACAVKVKIEFATSATALPMISAVGAGSGAQAAAPATLPSAPITKITLRSPCLPGPLVARFTSQFYYLNSGTIAQPGACCPFAPRPDAPYLQIR